MNFDQAILAHSKWKTRLKSYINGEETVDVAILSKDDQCDLGKWLYGEAKTQFAAAGLDTLADLKAKHAKFHAVAASVAHKARSCSREEGLKLLELNSEFGSASSACINALVLARGACKK